MNDHHTLENLYVTMKTRVIWMVTSLIVCVVTTDSAVSANDLDLAKLDVRTLVSRMTPLKGTTPAQWRVIWTNAASREATISWTTAEPGKKHIVYYGRESGGRGGKPAYSQECQSNGIYSITQPNTPKPMDVDTPEQATKNEPPKLIPPAYYHHARI